VTAPGPNDRAEGAPDFRQLTDALPHIVWHSRPDGSSLYINAYGLRAIGPDRAPDDWSRIVHPDDVERLGQVWEQAAREGRAFEFEYRLLQADGSYRWYSARGGPLHGPGGEIEWWVGAATDIHDLKRSEEALRRAQRKAAATAALIEATQEAAPVAFGFMDPQLRVVRLNRVMAALSELDPEAQIGRPLPEVLGDFWPRVEPYYRHVLETGEAVGLREVVGPGDPDDPATPVWLASYYPVHVDGELTGVGVVAIDISARLRAEREAGLLEHELEHARRMETTGHMAGALAHDFNNLLSIILNYADFALEALDDHPAAEDVRQAREAAREAAELTGKLLVLSRHERFTTERLDVAVLLRELEPVLDSALTERIALEIAVADDLWTIEADRERLEQVVMNLIVNARDAMPEGGAVRVEAANVELDAEAVRLRPHLQPGHYVRLSIRDDGPGMAPEVAEHAFDPFFTTKPLGKGTGLGLATVYSVVTEAGGDVAIDSHLGEGTTLHVTWPAITGAAETQGPPEAGAAAPPATAGGVAGARRVLVVDDEPAIRRLAARILRAHGFEVLEAESGDAALASGASAEILLTDVVMPGISGPQLAERMLAEGRVDQVAFMSGHPPQPEALDPRAPFLPKPFAREELLQLLERLCGT
jgi:two-component system, cell cycle sensor histidine kinase and response regulator CckA